MTTPLASIPEYTNSNPAAEAGMRIVKYQPGTPFTGSIVWQGQTVSVQLTPISWEEIIALGQSEIIGKTANYNILAADDGKWFTFNGSSLTANLPSTIPVTATPGTWKAIVLNLNASALTLSGNGLYVNTQLSISIPQYGFAIVGTDGTNYIAATAAGSSGGSQPYDVWFAPNVVMGSGTIYRIGKFTRTVTFAGNFTGSQVDVAVAPATTQTIQINKNGSSVGTITITSTSVVTFTSTGGSAVVFNAGDILSYTNQSGADPNMLIEITLSGTR